MTIGSATEIQKPMQISAEAERKIDMPKLVSLYKYMGDRSYSFTNSNGEQISGKSLYIAFVEENVNGYCTDKVNLRPEIELPSGIKYGDDLVIQFDRKGKVISVSKAN